LDAGFELLASERSGFGIELTRYVDDILDGIDIKVERASIGYEILF
jgi:hypothetical protein